MKACSCGSIIILTRHLYIVCNHKVFHEGAKSAASHGVLILGEQPQLEKTVQHGLDQFRAILEQVRLRSVHSKDGKS